MTPGGAVNLAFLRAHFKTAVVLVTDTARQVGMSAVYTAGMLLFSLQQARPAMHCMRVSRGLCKCPPAVACPPRCREHEGCGPCQQMQLADFLDWWEFRQQQQQQQDACAGIEALHIQSTATPHPDTAVPQPGTPGQAQPAGMGDDAAQAPTAAALPPAGGPLWYAKDWHLASEFPQYQAYRCPLLFADDWLNEWCDACQAGARQQAGASAGAAQEGKLGDAGQQQQQQQQASTADYRFVYLGPRVRQMAALHR